MQVGPQGVHEQQGSPEIFREVSTKSCIQGCPLQVKGIEAERGIRDEQQCPCQQQEPGSLCTRASERRTYRREFQFSGAVLPKCGA